MTPGGLLRLAIALGLLVVLAWLFVLAGAKEPVSPQTEPSAEAFAGNAEAYLGQEVEFSGVVVDAEAARVEIGSHDNVAVVTIEGAPPLEEGHRVTFGGIAVDATTIETSEDRVAVRAPWEFYYMYGISAVGALLAGLMALNYWRFDPRKLGFVPREEPLVAVVAGGSRRG